MSLERRLRRLESDHAEPPIFEITEGGHGLVHDEGAQAFYSKGGHFAVSRERVDLRHLMWPGRG